MATAVTLKKGMAIQKSYVGFSWTTFFSVFLSHFLEEIWHGS